MTKQRKPRQLAGKTGAITSNTLPLNNSTSAQRQAILKYINVSALKRHLGNVKQDQAELRDAVTTRMQEAA
jgi:hypothetical protein